MRSRVSPHSANAGRRADARAAEGDGRDALLGGQVTEAIRNAIADGRLLAGQRLVERDLAQWLKVSRSPVREALHRLEEEGLVAYRPNSGAHVAVLSLDDIREIYEVRAALERVSGQRAAHLATDADLVELSTLVDEMEAAAGRGDLARQGQADMAFHNKLAQIGGNGRSIALLESLRAQIAQVIHFSIVATPAQARIDDHRFLIACIRQGEVALAAACEAHVRRAGETAIEAVSRSALHPGGLVASVGRRGTDPPPLVAVSDDDARRQQVDGRTARAGGPREIGRRRNAEQQGR